MRTLSGGTLRCAGLINEEGTAVIGIAAGYVEHEYQRESLQGSNLYSYLASEEAKTELRQTMASAWMFKTEQTCCVPTTAQADVTFVVSWVPSVQLWWIVSYSPRDHRQGARISDTQRQALQMLASGATIPDVATALEVTDSAVSQQLSKLRECLGIGSNYGLVAWAIHHAIIDYPPKC
jgi:DNA-binding NarL/FixJ family response regulator